MDQKLQAEVERILQNASIASVRSWIRSKGKRLSAGTRQRMIERVAALIEKSEIVLADLEDAIVGIEEAGGKFIVLYRFDEDRSPAAVREQLAKMGYPLAQSRSLGKPSGDRSALSYALLQGNRIRISWSEVHKKPKMDFEDNSVVYEQVKKVIVLTVDLSAKYAEIRYDRPETFHPHSSTAKSKNAYFDYYQKLGEEILQVKLIKSELRDALRKLIEMSPPPVRLHPGGHTNKRNNYFSGTVREKGSDIRDDDEYKAMFSKGGRGWSYDDQSFYWRAEQSERKLNREVFSHVDAVTSSIRVDADCWDAEVDYAVEKIRGLQ